ncbi:hypothetical protein [Pseudooceanicola sp. 200-1SW]|uniref:hypothetical protein n=1 Tax=Pseudooceanicola sp. 200-1SW TaxID=3425949 RepID=UPI003D7F615F
MAAPPARRLAPRLTRVVVLPCLLAALATALPAAGPLRDASLSDGPPPSALFLAECAGRLSALMEHQWLLSSAAAPATEARRARMLARLAAIPAAASPRALLAGRIEAKAAQAALLGRASFARTEAERRAASRLAARLLAPCDSAPNG